MSATRATGSFEVRLAPQPTDAAPLARLSIDRQFSGDLAATSKGEMLAFQSGTEGSAGYVALERGWGRITSGWCGAIVSVRTSPMWSCSSGQSSRV